MLTEIPYITLFNYSPRGNSEISVISQKFVAAIKAGRIEVINWATDHLTNNAIDISSFLNEEVSIIPIPKSSLLVEGAIWPSQLIANSIFNLGLVREVLTCVTRVTPVKKSSSGYSSDTRPSVSDHVNSLNVIPVLSPPSNITLIDDVLTLGRTSFAVAKKIATVYPDAIIRLFSIARTQGLIKEIIEFYDLSIGSISYNPNTDKTTRNDP